MNRRVEARPAFLPCFVVFLLLHLFLPHILALETPGKNANAPPSDQSAVSPYSRWGLRSVWPNSHNTAGHLLGDAEDSEASSTLNNLVLGEVLIVSSIEGGIYGIDRVSGATRWSHPAVASQRTNATDHSSKQDNEQSSPFEPLIAQSYGPNRRSYSDLAANMPLIDATSIASHSDDHTSGQDALDALQELGMYIVEPNSGQLYILNSNPSSASGETRLSKLPLTLPQLVELSPFSFPGDASRVFVGHKTTSLVELDVRTGKIGAVFGGKDAGLWCSQEEAADNLDQDTDKERLDNSTGSKAKDECAHDYEKNKQWAYMGRTDYTLTIHLRGRPTLSQTLHFSTFAPNTADRDIASLWLSREGSGDHRVVMGMPEEGSIVCFNTTQHESHSSDRQERTLWINDIGVTVAGIFDVVYTADSLQQGNPQPMILPHPSISLQSLFADLSSPFGRSNQYASMESVLGRQATYLGLSNGHLYAMGNDRFPLVAFTPPAAAAYGISAEAHAGHHHHSGASGPATCASHGCLLGSYEVNNVGGTGPSADQLLGLGPGQAPLLGIGDGSDQPTQPRAEDRSTNSPADSDRAPEQRPKGPSSSWTSPSMVMTQIIALFLLAILCGLVYIGGHELHKQRAEEARNISRDMVWTPFAPDNDSTKAALDAKGTRSPSKTRQDPTPNKVHESSDSNTRDEVQSTTEAIDASGSDILDKKKPARRRKRGKRAGTAVQQRELKRDGSKGTIEEDSGEEMDGDTSRAMALDTTAKPPVAKMEDTFESDSVHQITQLAAKQLLTAEGGSEVTLASGGSVVTRGTNRSLIISEDVLGYGSSGTVVFRGTFQGRAVAVKRLLRDFVEVASKEVSLLESADNHPNVIRYFYKEVTDSFLFIALELCPASLADIIEKPREHQELSAQLKPKKALFQIASGLQHLHTLSIVHRDIKPQNILVSYTGGKLKMLLSDFGLSKRLDGVAQTSFSQTVDNPGGTVGWRAPEILRGDVCLDASGEGTNSSMGSQNTTRPDVSQSSNGANKKNGADERKRLTRAVDVFALGCLAYYVLSNGEHPFGSRFEREINILRKHIDLQCLDGLGEEGHEAQHMIMAMIRHDPNLRPTATNVLSHPYFWDAGRRLAFLQDASDRFDIMERDPPTAALVALELNASHVLGGTDWHRRIDRQVMEDLNKRRRYDPKSVAALLRAIRNKKHHIHDVPPGVKRLFITAAGASDQAKLLPDGFLAYFTLRFPRLFLHTYEVIDANEMLKCEPSFAPYFVPVHSDV